MRKLLFFLTLTTLSFTSEERVAVLSYFVSGTHFFNYCLTQLTGRSWEKTVLNDYCVSLRNEEHACPEKTPFIHQHHYRHLQKLDPKTDKLLFLLRNNKENLIRQVGSDRFDGLFDCIARHQKGYRDCVTYYKNIIMFDNWEPKNRLLIYYKDLMERPKETFEKVLAFLDEDFDRWDDFFDNFEDHKHFSHQIRTGRTDGKLIHYTEMISREKLIAYDKKVQETYPNIYEKYLKPFETQ